MSWFLWWIVASAVGSEGFEHVRTKFGCDISMRPREGERPVTMRADCAWPDVDASVLREMIGDFERYPEFVFPVDVSEVRRRDERGRALVYQRQEMVGISDREVLLWMREEPVGQGVRFAWEVAAEEPLTLRSGAIRTPYNTGYWQVTPRAEGGAEVVHQITMDGGGTIPQWIINMVRTRGFARVMRDVHDVAATTQ